MSSVGLKKLSKEQRLEIWWNQHKNSMCRNAHRYRTFLENFTIGYEEPSVEAYLNFKHDLNLYQYQHPNLLLENFLAIYNTSKILIVVKGMKKI